MKLRVFLVLRTRKRDNQCCEGINYRDVKFDEPISTQHVHCVQDRGIIPSTKQYMDAIAKTNPSNHSNFAVIASTLRGITAFKFPEPAHVFSAICVTNQPDMFPTEYGAVQ